MNNLVIGDSAAVALGFQPGVARISTSFFPPCAQSQCTFPSQVVSLQAGTAMRGPTEDVIRFASLVSNASAFDANRTSSACNSFCGSSR